MDLQFSKDGQDISGDFYASEDATEVRAWTEDSTCLASVQRNPDTGKWEANASDELDWTRIGTYDSWEAMINEGGFIVEPHADYPHSRDGDLYDCGPCEAIMAEREAELS